MGQARTDARSVSSDYLEHCAQILRNSGGRVTQPRLAVIRALAESPKSLSPREILEKIKANKKMPPIDQVTVYRILEAFSELGLVHQVASGEFIACSHVECDADMHILARCISCGKFEELEVPADVLAPVSTYLTRTVEFQPKEHFMQVNGTCTRCSKKTTAKASRAKKH